MGWIGSRVEMIAALKAAGAKCDEDGNVCLYSVPPYVGCAGEEIVVDDRMQCLVDGEPRFAAELLREAGVGVNVRVF